MRGAFESKYGAPTNDNKKVLIGMKGGKAVYGDELDAVDTSGNNVINNTYSQNQAIMNDMSKEMAQSGGMYNPSARDIRAAEAMSPVTEADRSTTQRASDKQVMVGAYSADAAKQRERFNQTADQRFAATMTRLNTPAGTTAPAVGGAQPTGLPSVPYSNPLLDILGGQQPTEITPAPAFDVKGENATFLTSLRGKNTLQQPSVVPPTAANQKGTTNKPQTPAYSPNQNQVLGMLAFGEELGTLAYGAYPEDRNSSKNRRGNYA